MNLLNSLNNPKYKTTLQAKIIETPVGGLFTIADDEYLYMLDFSDLKNIDKKIEKLVKTNKVNIKIGESKIIEQVESELKDYFSGNLKEFKTKINLSGTDFQNSVWKSLLNVEHGKTISYSDLAKDIGNEKAVRAVASGVGANILPIIIPCHRIIGKDGSLTGYSGGIERKKFLLNLEKSY